MNAKEKQELMGKTYAKDVAELTEKIGHAIYKSQLPLEITVLILETFRVNLVNTHIENLKKQIGA